MPQLLKIPSSLVRDHQAERTGSRSAGLCAIQDAAARIERLAKIGATPEDIAAELQMPLKRLNKRFRRELERGAVLGKHDVLEKLFENASSGANASATSL